MQRFSCTLVCLLVWFVNIHAMASRPAPITDSLHTSPVVPAGTAKYRQFPGLKAPSQIAPTAHTGNQGLYREGLIAVESAGGSAAMPADSVQYYIGKARAVIAEIRQYKKFVGYLDGASLLQLPVGLHTEIGGLAYDIGIASITLKPQYAELEVYMQFTMPQNGKELTFMGKGIKFTKEGGIVGDARLQLVGNYAINLDGNKAQIILKNGTYATFDCNGFRNMALNADIVFSRDLLLPDDGNGNILPNGRLTTSFTTEISDWNNLLVQIDLPAFQLPGMLGVTFAVRHAVFDFSDTHNAPGIQFPADYQHPDIQAGLPNLWRGFYLRELSITLPRQFERTGNTQRTSFAAYDLLIDNLGLTGALAGTNLIGTDEGNMNGWAYSLDSIGISLKANQLVKGGFNGTIVLPVASEAYPFAYQAIINPGNEYILNVQAAEDMQFDVFKTSKVEIHESSYLEIALTDDRFYPKATLSGKMTIAAPLSDNESSGTIKLADIAFQNLRIQTTSPYIQAESFSVGSEAANQLLAGLPVSINNVGFVTPSTQEVGLQFDLNVNLNESFGGQAGLTILGALPADSPIQKWRYSTTKIDELLLDIDQGAFKFYGRLAFFRNDPNYGYGFNGEIDARFKPGIQVKATAIFGTTGNYRYWYADALATFGKPIPVAPPFGINGFGGGAYYRMKMATGDNISPLGQTSSGIVYIPDPQAGLGIRASVSYAIAGASNSINGEATYEAAFYATGGLRSITFTGNIFVLTAPYNGSLPDKLSKTTENLAKVAQKNANGIIAALLPDDASTIEAIYGSIGEAAGKRGNISGHVRFLFDFENKSLHANMEMYVNVAGGIIKGTAERGKAGWAVVHFAPEDWYFYLGTPEQRIGLQAGLGPVSARLDGYFLVGTKIPGSPPPPPKIAEILGNIDLDYMKNQNALGLGKGFGFGASLGINTGTINFLVFYGMFDAELGFDMMLKDYGMNARCKGSSEIAGINGWYANGQAYGYFDGTIGIRTRLFGKNLKVEILSIKTAALLQAKLPNPFWMRGIVGGRFSVLGGLVKGNCRFEATIGQECEMVTGSVVEGMKIIAEITPNDGEKDISVFNSPQVLFNMPIEQAFEIVDVDDIKKKFRIRLDEFAAYYNKKNIPADLVWNATQDIASLNFYDVLPSQEEITLLAQVSVEEYVNGTWRPVVVDGKRFTEKMSGKFKTDQAPDYIPAENIAYSYPLLNQVNFYKDEYKKGYIKLKKGQPYLFEVDTRVWRQTGRISTTGGESTEFRFAYSNTTREINFELPELPTGTILTLDIVNIPVATSTRIDRNVRTVANKIVLNETTTLDTEINTKKAEGTIENLQEQTIFSNTFRTSIYPTLAAKIKDVAPGSVWRWPIRNGVHQLLQKVSLKEPFDIAEIVGKNGAPPLIDCRAILANNKYYSKQIYPVVYAGYPINNSITITWRNIDKIGLPPAKAVSIEANYANLTNQELNENFYLPAGTDLIWNYNLVHYYQKDMLQLQNKAANYYYRTKQQPGKRVRDLLTTTFPVLPEGTYDIEIAYKLPGKNITGSKQTITIDFKIK